MIDRVWEEISYSKLNNNLQQIKNRINGKKIICMVKDNAYGHGSVKIAEYLSKDDSVKSFAVASITEASILKQNGINKDIIIISHINKNNYKEAIENNFIMTVSSLEQVNEINAVAKSLNKIAKIEIAIDTGMSRIGFVANNETVNYISQISILENIKIYGLFSHFSVADTNIDDKENILYTDEQEKKFIDIIKKIDELGIIYENTSLANSAGILTNRAIDTTTVRPGIILYGIMPSDAFNDNSFKPIMSLKSKIIHIKEINKNTSISYGRTFISNDKMKIATVSCGYGDGYPRTASNKAEVIINDTKCKIVGRVTMDMLMVDVTNVDCKVDDDVILIGESKTQQITLNGLCEKTNEFTYEIMTRINHRVEKIYID